MSEDIQSLIASVDTNKILVLVLEQIEKISIPTEKFMTVSKEDKELVIDYDDSVPAFIFSVRDKTK